ncbi:TPA: putative colanic acid biosynthesis acetyltransferase [Klebsiella pneumoniae]|nr:putative colanic acid biosynthesis acetyltransferase [Klebsiella pneumoniae]HBT0330825.1 putative colanic acid biosynthesis acetyltransferase [Klebsiella pneumoniae]
MVSVVITKVSFSLGNRFYRLLWNLVYSLFFCWTPVYLFKWRVLLLKIFGCQLDWSARIYPTSKIWSPKNLRLGSNVTIAPRVSIYNQGLIEIGDSSLISQDSSLCASTHDYRKTEFPLLLKPITIGRNVWVCSEAFVGPGVHIGDGAVLGARAVAKKSLDAWHVYDGNPCQKINIRKMELTNEN